MKLRTGQTAPAFITEDIWRQKVDLYNMGHEKILLSFFRYAECPLCNMQISRVMALRDKFIAAGIHFIAVFESPAESLKSSIAERHQFNFTLIADPERKLYNLYGVNPSWLKTLSTLRVSGIKSVFKAFKSGYMPSLKIEGKINQIPADFLLNNNHIIDIAHYGTDTTDHLKLEKIL